MRDTATFPLALVATGAKKTLARMPLACPLADYCSQQGISQAELIRYMDCSPESFRRIALYTGNVDRLIEVLQGMHPIPVPIPVPVPVRRRRGRPPKESNERH